MSPRLTRILGVVRQVGLTVGAVLGALCIVVTVAAVVLDVRPLVFLSGSMSPTIETGALAISHRVDAGSLEAGQIVSVPTGSGERVTHRIQSVEHDGDTAVLVLKGDANEAADATPYVVDHADEVLFSVPWLGYVVDWLTGPVGLFLLGLYAALLLSVIVRPGGRDRGKHAAPALVLLVGAGLVPGLVLESRTAPTLAAWTDPSTVTGTTMSAYTVPAPPNTSCTVVAAVNSTRGVDLAWPTVTAVPLSYVPASADVTATTTVVPGPATTILQVRYDSSTAPANTIGTVTAYAHPTGVPSWTSPVSTWKFKTGKAQSSQPTCQELTAPALTLDAPAAGNQTAAAKASAVKTACGKKYLICGTVSDASGVASVEFKIQKGTQCWQDSSDSYGSDCTTWQQADTSAVWSDTNNRVNVADDAYPSADTYTVTVRATDEWANTTSVVRSFTLS